MTTFQETILNDSGVHSLSTGSEVEQRAYKNIAAWLADDTLLAYRPYISHLVTNRNYATLLDSFWRVMPFGTGGRRGPIGAGPNRINPYTITLSVQGHCDYLRDVMGLKGDISVVLAFDVRRFCDLRGLYVGVDGILKDISSKDLARECAMTYAANGVVTYVNGPLADEPDGPTSALPYVSTPELSFLIRELHAAGGLNVSASHNHPDDNGGKFYNAAGGQEIPPDDERLLGVVEKVTAVKKMSYAQAREAGLIRFIPPSMHTRYIDLNTALCPTASRAAKIAFTPLCGTGNTTVREALEALGFEVVPVAEQSVYDGSFASVPFRIPNPEVPQSMHRLNEVATANGCHVAFATDPDADRLGITVKDGDGGFTFLNGNEIGVVLVESLLSTKKKAGTLPAHPIFVNTAVTSSLQREIARRYGCQVIGDLMVGFKYIGDVLKHLEQSGQFPPTSQAQDGDQARGTLDDFLLADEESHGYLLTPHIRDKDACGAAVFLAGVASQLAEENQTAIELLRDIYRVYGYYRNQLRFLVMEGIVGLERIRRIQDRLRENPPAEIAGMKVRRAIDYHKVGGPIKSSTDEASRNVLSYELDMASGKTMRITVRPSGTEPKTKVYIEVPSGTGLTGTLSDVSEADLRSVTDADLDDVIKKTNDLATFVGNEFIKFCLGPDVLGDVYSEVPAESLLVSDLVPVDQKIALCASILPALVAKLKDDPAADVDAWLNETLKPFGEDPKGLVQPAVAAWIERYARENKLDTAISDRVIGLF
ncbi:MAG: phospho-sugar mutase [Myxococcota bacterium]|nr:phospho-sugar mutase [Myxococcota bacterium]